MILPKAPNTLRGLAPLAAILLLLACGDDDASQPDPEPAHGHGHGMGSHGHGHDHGGARPAAPPARVSRLEGEATVNGAQARMGMPLEPESTIVVQPGGLIHVLMRDGGRFALEPETTARVVAEGPTQLLLARGRVHASQPARGNAARPPLRLATPAATVELASAGEAYISTYANGSTWMTSLSGAVAVNNGEADNRHRARETTVGQGGSVAVAERVAEPTEGPERLEGARAAAAALAGGEGMSEADTEAVQRNLTQRVASLDESLRWLETETRRGSELTNQHRAAVQAGDRDEARRLQREVVGHSQELYRLRRVATSRWERVRALHMWLGLLDAQPTEDPVAARRDRVAGLLGFH